LPFSLNAPGGHLLDSTFLQFAPGSSLARARETESGVSRPPWNYLAKCRIGNSLSELHTYN
jgi:hypothetical protein